MIVRLSVDRVKVGLYFMRPPVPVTEVREEASIYVGRVSIKVEAAGMGSKFLIDT